MAEELRFFLRTAVYAAVVATVYWFVSGTAQFRYDWAGTVMLAFVVFATGIVVTVAGIAVEGARGDLRPSSGTPLGRAVGTLNRILGFADRTDRASDQPLAHGLEPIPQVSVWPIIAGFAALLIGLGLVFGPFLLVPGIAVAAGTIWGWLTQLDVR